jgi:nucleoside-diphosphate-sugar epimerase
VKRIAIIGAAGYVGMELARQLRDGTHEVHAIARENGQFLLRNSGFNLVAPSDLGTVGKVDLVVNLAYPSGSPNQFPVKNQEILAQIKSLMGPDSRLIHVSTQAVFGFGMDRPVVVGPVDSVRDYGYIEAKIELENLILHEFANQSVQIVRLGNVWGPGSGAWTVPMVNKILFGEAVGVQGVDGYCNATDVANVASYLAYLITRDDLRGVEFFHLAELSGYKWSAWIKRIEAALGQDAVFEPNLPLYPSSTRQEVRQAISPIMPGPFYKKLIWGRFSGSWLRSLVRKLGDKRFMQIKNKSAKSLPVGYTLGSADEMFLTILSAQVKFETSVLKEWVPPVDFTESWARVENWMRSAGYTILEKG